MRNTYGSSLHIISLHIRCEWRDEKKPTTLSHMTEHDVPAQTESAQCSGEATAAIRNKKKKLPASSTELFVIFPRQILSPFSMSNLVKDSLANNRKSRRLVKVVYGPIRHHLQQIRWRCAITLHNVIQYMIKSVGGCVPIVAVVVVIAFPRYNIIYVRCSRLPYAHCDSIHLQANTRHLPASQYLQIANFPRMRSEYILDALCVRVHCYRQNCTRHKLQCATHMRGKLFRCNDAHCTTPPVVI